VDAEWPLEQEHVALRVLTLLRERGRLANADIRRFSGFTRVQVYRLVKQLEAQGKVRLVGKGRGAYLAPVGGPDASRPARHPVGPPLARRKDASRNG
jgi:hypothetical protein